jgi:Holliday junction resolvase RusA-like endonuclease
MNIRLRVYGTPASQGSKRWLPNGRMIEADKKLKPWRHSVYEAVQHADILKEVALEGPVAVRVVFMFERPKNHYGSRKGEPYLKASAPHFVTRTPDVDKCLRALLDPLTEMKVWGDDSQVVIAHAVKRYCNDDEKPGALVLITDQMTGA